jgi:hypothetical protein
LPPLLLLYVRLLLLVLLLFALLLLLLLLGFWLSPSLLLLLLLLPPLQCSQVAEFQLCILQGSTQLICAECWLPQLLCCCCCCNCVGCFWWSCAAPHWLRNKQQQCAPQPHCATESFMRKRVLMILNGTVSQPKTWLLLVLLLLLSLQLALLLQAVRSVLTSNVYRSKTYP